MCLLVRELQPDNGTDTGVGLARWLHGHHAQPTRGTHLEERVLGRNRHSVSREEDSRARAKLGTLAPLFTSARDSVAGVARFDVADLVSSNVGYRQRGAAGPAECNLVECNADLGGQVALLGLAIGGRNSSAAGRRSSDREHPGHPSSQLSPYLGCSVYLRMIHVGAIPKQPHVLVLR